MFLPEHSDKTVVQLSKGNTDGFGSSEKKTVNGMI